MRTENNSLSCRLNCVYRLPEESSETFLLSVEGSFSLYEENNFNRILAVNGLSIHQDYISFNSILYTNFSCSIESIISCVHLTSESAVPFELAIEGSFFNPYQAAEEFTTTQALNGVPHPKISVYRDHIQSYYLLNYYTTIESIISCVHLTSESAVPFELAIEGSFFNPYRDNKYFNTTLSIVGVPYPSIYSVVSFFDYILNSSYIIKYVDNIITILPISYSDNIITILPINYIISIECKIFLKSVAPPGTGGSGAYTNTVKESSKIKFIVTVNNINKTTEYQFNKDQIKYKFTVLYKKSNSREISMRCLYKEIKLYNRSVNIVINKKERL